MALKQCLSGIETFPCLDLYYSKTDKMNLKLAPKEWKKLIYLVKSLSRNVLACCVTKINEQY